MKFQPASLSEFQRERVSRLEARLGVQIVALRYGESLATLTVEQLARLAKLERDTGLLVVAYDAVPPPSEEHMHLVKRLENELGLALVAYANRGAVDERAEAAERFAESGMAQLSESEVQQVQELEKELRLLLVAVRESIQ